MWGTGGGVWRRGGGEEERNRGGKNSETYKQTEWKAKFQTVARTEPSALLMPMTPKCVSTVLGSRCGEILARRLTVAL